MALKILKTALYARYGRYAWVHFIWEETAYPFGPPSWNDIEFGFRWAFSRNGKTIERSRGTDIEFI